MIGLLNKLVQVLFTVSSRYANNRESEDGNNEGVRSGQYLCDLGGKKRMYVCVHQWVGGWCVRVRVCVLQMMYGVFGCRCRSWGWMGWIDSTTTEDGDVWASITCRSSGEVEKRFATQKAMLHVAAVLGPEIKRAVYALSTAWIH